MAMAILTFPLSKVAKVKIRQNFWFSFVKMLKKQIAPFLVIKLYHTLAYSFGSEDISFELFHKELTDPTSFLGEKQMKWASLVLSYLLHVYSQV